MMDGRGQLYAAWYTEGARGLPCMLFATSPDGKRFAPSVPVTMSSGSIPDQVRLAVSPAGTAVSVGGRHGRTPARAPARQRANGGRMLGPGRVLTEAVKACRTT